MDAPDPTAIADTLGAPPIIEWCERQGVRHFVECSDPHCTGPHVVYRPADVSDDPIPIP